LFRKLRSYPNVLITGHQGFLTNEALQGIATATIANLNAWAYNGISVNEVKQSSYILKGTFNNSIKLKSFFIV
jgi:phosphoglycerate dehydrogenase-like enzyme